MENTFILHSVDTLKVLGGSIIEMHSNQLTNFMNDGWWSLGVLVLFMLVIFLILRMKALKNIVFNHLKLLAVFVWILGTVLYWIGFNEHGCEWNWLALTLRASLSSVEMFVSHSDLIEVGEAWHHNSCYMSFFSIVHFLAVLISGVFIVKIFGLRLKLWWRKLMWRFGPSKTLYVFGEMNHASILLAKQMKKEGKIVFVYDEKREHANPDLMGMRYSFSHLIGHRLVSNSFEELVVEELDGIILSFNTKSICSYIKKIPCKEIKYIFLSDDEKENIDGYNEILDAGLLDDVTATCYCHASRTAENKALAKMNDENGTEMEPNLYLIDSSYLSVLELKQDSSAHPINYVNIQKGGVVEDSFRALVVGFGETGKEAMSFLYEFSAFLGPNDVRSPYKLVAIDSNMNKIKGGYYAQRPALNGNENLELQEADVNSEAYWNIVKGIVDEGLNYVIVSLGDDELNVRTALALYEYAMRFAVKNGDMLCYNHGRFVIYVKVNDDRYEYLCQNVYDSTIIKFFGKKKTIFTKDIVLNEKHNNNATMFKNAYNEVKSKYRKDKTKMEIEILREAERKTVQNLGNSYHEATKIKLLTIGLTEEEKKKLLSIKRYPQDQKNYKGQYWYVDENNNQLEDETKLMTNVAKCEHLRWNATMEMLGYEKNENDCSSCCEFTMKHNCLTSWDDLHGIWLDTGLEYKQYDYIVVENCVNKISGKQ